MSQQQITTKLNQTISCLPDSILKNYSNSYKTYLQTIIPFEINRIKQSKAISSKATSLQRHKIGLQSKINSLKTRNRQFQHTLQNQSDKINDLERTVVQLDKANNDNLSILCVMEITKKQMEQDLQENVEKVKKAEQLKKQKLKEYQIKNNQYNILLSNYMKDKNIIAEKLNFMNQLQQSLFDKQKKMKQQQIYLKKQWQQLQIARNQAKKKVIKKPQSKQNLIKPNQPQTNPIPSVKKIQKFQLLSNPKKKIIGHHKGEIYDMSVNANNSYLATCGADRIIKIYNIQTFQTKTTIKALDDNNFLTLSLNINGQLLVVGNNDKSVEIYETETGKQLHKFIQHGLKVNSVSWLPEKGKVVSGSQDKTIKVWDLEKATNINSIACGKQVRYVTSHQNQALIYSGHSDGSVRIYSPNSQSPTSQIKGIIDYPITCITPLPSNPTQLLVSSQQGSPIHLFDLKQNKSLFKYQAKQFFNKNTKIQISPSQKFLIAGNCDGYIYYWNKQKNSFDKKISGHDYSIMSVKYIEGMEKNLLASGDIQGNIIIWE